MTSSEKLKSNRKLSAPSPDSQWPLPCQPAQTDNRSSKSHRNALIASIYFINLEVEVLRLNEEVDLGERKKKSSSSFQHVVTFNAAHFPVCDFQRVVGGKHLLIICMWRSNTVTWTDTAWRTGVCLWLMVENEIERSRSKTNVPAVPAQEIYINWRGTESFIGSAQNILSDSTIPPDGGREAAPRALTGPHLYLYSLVAAIVHVFLQGCYHVYSIQQSRDLRIQYHLCVRIVLLFTMNRFTESK